MGGLGHGAHIHHRVRDVADAGQNRVQLQAEARGADADADADAVPSFARPQTLIDLASGGA